MKKLLENKYFLTSFIVSLVLLISGVTFAWYVETLSDTNVAFEVDGIYVNYNGGSNISNASLIPVMTKEEGIVKEITVSVDKDVTPTPTFNLYLKVNTLETGLNHASFKWELYKNEDYVSEGTFETVNEGDTVTLTTGQTISTTEDEYTLYIWIDASVDNPDSMNSQDFSFELYANGENAIETEASSTVVLANHITSLYTNATKTSVENGEEGSTVTYQYAKDYSLMSDIAGNVRYYGADPDNYIYFNCETYPETNCEKWRIIGVFEGKVKIMRNSIIGSYSWDTSASGINNGYGINQWGESTYSTDGSTYKGADLMKLLNPGYESESYNNSLYYNGGSGNCYNSSSNSYTTCNFSSTGLKNDTTRGLISETLYYLGAYNSTSVYSDAMYEKERGTLTGSKSSDNVNRTTTWTGRVGIPYPSDYGYAADLGSCTVQLGSYNNANCTSNNWMKPIFTASYNWLMTPHSGASNGARGVFSSGDVYHYDYTHNANGVAPVLYLNSDVVVEAGTGDVNSPYKLSVS